MILMSECDRVMPFGNVKLEDQEKNGQYRLNFLPEITFYVQDSMNK